MILRARIWVPLMLVAAAIGAAAADTPTNIDSLPIIAEGGNLKLDDRLPDFTGEPKLSREVVLPTRGVWYLWLKVSHMTTFPKNQSREPMTPVLIKYNLDGKQPLRGPRTHVPVPPFVTSQWLSHTRANPSFMAQVYVDAPGTHTLNLEIDGGAVIVERIALTLFHGAVPSGDTLDHTDDPGEGRATFSASPIQVDGFREDWQSPPVTAAGTSYHVDATAGNDANDGTAPERAWKSLININSRTFVPGDAILLKRGAAWTEGLAPKGSGAADAPIWIGAYGDGAKPLVNGIDKPGVSLTDQSYWIVQDVQATSDVEHGALGGGIVVTARGPERPKGIAIRNCVGFDSGGHGIYIGAPWETEARGIDGVVIENCLAFANAGAGIEIGGNTRQGGRNSVIRNCTAYANGGMAGIWIHSGENGLIEHCVGYNNGVFQVWTWNSANITMRCCEGYRALTVGDRGGFDIDWGCNACTLEYCYSHHNQGPGGLLMGSGSGAYLGFANASRYNICRYNIFAHDGGIVVMENFEDGKVYNNVVIAHNSDWSVRDQGHAALDVYGWEPSEWYGGWPANNEFYNNILIALDDALTLWVDEEAAKKNNVFDNNLHWKLDADGAWIKWAGRWLANPTEYPSLAAFRDATGQEAHGLQTDPQLRDALNSGSGRLPLDELLLQEGSPARAAGRNVILSEEWLTQRRKLLNDTGAEAYGIDMEPRPVEQDYWGNKLRPEANVSIGANEPESASEVTVGAAKNAHGGQ